MRANSPSWSGTRLHYYDKQGTGYEMGEKIAQIHQETQVEEVVAQEKKTSGKNRKNNSIILKGYIKWCAQDKINNKEKSGVQ